MWWRLETAQNSFEISRKSLRESAPPGMGGFVDDVMALSVRFGIEPSVPLPAAIAQMNMLMGMKPHETAVS
eukprot:7377107-Prymnesium_polylepis.1